MSTTFKSAFRYEARVNSPVQEHVNIDDELSSGEMASIRREKEMASMRVNGNGDVERFCWCAELVVNGKRIPCPVGHNCGYVAQRSALVPDAETAALRMPGDFTKNFVAEMNRLAAPLLNGSTS